MKRKFNILFIILYSMLHISCSSEKDNKKQIIDGTNLILTDSNIELKYDVLCLIKDYMHNYPQFNAFVLMTSNELLIDGSYYPKGFFLGPAYDGLFKNTFPIFYIKLDEKYIFVASDVENLAEISNASHSIFLKEVIPRGVDSLELASGWIIKNGDELYMYRAIYFSKNKAKEIFVNNRPDTIFMPKLDKIIDFN